MQRGHHFAIVDEVDSILIDEARTPLIISGAGTQAAETYNKFARVMPGLVPEVDFDMDEAKKTINATESGLEKIEAMLGIDDIYADPSGQLANHLQQALKAQFLFHRDVDYVVVDGEVEDRRRVHRPHHGGPPLVRGPAPGDGGQGRACSCARRTRRSPPSRCRTTSASTRSSPA